MHTHIVECYEEMKINTGGCLIQQLRYRLRQLHPASECLVLVWGLLLVVASC